MYESEHKWLKIAQMLIEIDMESRIRVLDETYKLSQCVQIACIYLEVNDAVNVEAFINKAYV